MGGTFGGCKIIYICDLIVEKQDGFSETTIMRVDKVGAVFIAGHITFTSCMKHVDQRYKYVKM